MNHKLDILIKDIYNRPELLEELNKDPVKISERYSVSLVLIESIKQGDVLNLYRNGAHPIFLMHLSRALGFDIMERYKEQLAAEKQCMKQ